MESSSGIVKIVETLFGTVKTLFNPLTPRRAHVSPFTEISILFSTKKIPMSVAPMSGRRKEPILGYIPKIDEKKIWSIKG